MSYLYPNGHTLYRLTERREVPCWRIGHLTELTAQLTDEEIDAWDGVSTSDYPNGLTHDATCRTCSGTGVMLETFTVAYQCGGCGGSGDLRSFDDTSCLQYGAGYFDELKALHDLGEHDDVITVVVEGRPPTTSRVDHWACPSCITRRLAEPETLRSEPVE